MRINLFAEDERYFYSIHIDGGWTTFTRCFYDEASGGWVIVYHGEVMMRADGSVYLKH